MSKKSQTTTDHQNQPQSQSQQTTTADQSQTVNQISLEADDGSHLADVIVPEIDDDIQDVDAPVSLEDYKQAIDDAETEVATDGQISTDQFWIVFKSGFEIPAMLLPNMDALAIQESEKKNAKSASDATYRLLEIYYPSALQPQSEVVANILVALPFFVGKAMVVKAALDYTRQSKAIEVQKNQQSPSAGQFEPPAANDNHAPDESDGLAALGGAA